MTSGKYGSNFSVKFSILVSYWGCTDLVTWSFLASRIACLPLERFHRTLSEKGKIVEIGCGHGLVTQYLARRGPAREVIGYDPDQRRIPIAKAAARKVPNLTYQGSYFDAGSHRDLSAVAIIGVCCLLDDAVCLNLLSAARASLRPGGVLLLSEILEDKNDWRYAFHIWRERWFARIGFTQGQGLFTRPLATWEKLVHNAGFDRIEPFKAPVPLHSVFNWACS